MAHTVRNKVKLLNRVRRVRGQVEAVERALEDEARCADVLQLIAACRGAINGLMSEVLEEHIRGHILDGRGKPSERSDAAEELIDVVRTYVR